MHRFVDDKTIMVKGKLLLEIVCHDPHACTGIAS